MERMMDNETFDEVLNSFKEADNIVKRLKTRIAELEEENKKLKSDLAYERTMLDNVRAEYKSLQNVKKRLEEELERYREHTLSVEGEPDLYEDIE